MAFDGFGQGATRFFEELAANNTRDWWHANKAWYEADVRAPLEHLLADLDDEFGEAKVFRPNRDTRFSADKSPYKTAAAAVIGNPDGGPSTLYVHLSADGLMLGGGCYHPAKDQLVRLREAIADDGAGTELEAIVAHLERSDGHVESHDQLKTAPRGYPADHPRIRFLRMKGMVGMFDHPPAPWLHTKEALDIVAADWRLLGPLNEWLDRNVGPSELPESSRR
jgi:uncharacterized protein (TIGR02453 family)